MFFFGLLFAVIWSSTVYINWINNPILTTVQSPTFPVGFVLSINLVIKQVRVNSSFDLYQIHTYPFPSISICSVNKVSTKDLAWYMASEPE